MTAPPAKPPASAIPVFLQRRALVVVAILTLAGAIALYASTAWPIVVFRLLSDGALVLIWVLACAGWGETILTRVAKRLEEIPAMLRFSTSAGIGMGLISL